jgi:hypothetical protein
VEFSTSTGTIYTIRNGRLRRDSSVFQYPKMDIGDWPCVRLMSSVTVGECVRMYVYGRGYLYTTPVVEIVSKGL